MISSLLNYNPLGNHGTHTRIAQKCEDSTANFLVLKPAFMESLNSATPCWISLMTWENMRWDVRVEGNTQHARLTGGWATFRNAYCITTGDIIVFAYDKKSTFTVTIFDRDGKERGPTPHFNTGMQISTPLAAPPQLTIPAPAIAPAAPVVHIGPVIDRTSGGQEIHPSIPKIALFAEFNVDHIYSSKFKLPIEFAKAFLQPGVTEVDLKVKLSWVWKVTCQVCDGEAAITTGWKTFASDNNLTIGDACRIQPVGGEPNTWLVKIYRKDK